MDFKNKVVWITGASSGIGKEMAIQFAQHGAKVAVSARRIERLEELVEEIEKPGGQAIALKCDVSNDTEIKETVEKIIHKFGKLDIAVANAGFGVGGKIEQLTIVDWKRQLDVNVLGLVSTINHALPHLKKANGQMVLMSSIASMINLPAVAPYCASKAAVRSIGEALTMELRGSGTSCTTLYPGFIDSEIGQVDNKGVYRSEWKDKRPKKLMWPTDKAVKHMLKGISKRKRSVVITGHGKILAFFGRHFPGLMSWAMGKMDYKPN